MDLSPVRHKVVGRRVPRVDAGERVTGRAVYPADFTLPNMAHGRIKRSPYPHARIMGIDASKALALKGVLAVVTAADFPDLPLGSTAHASGSSLDTWFLSRMNMAREKVFWIGHAVAAVAAIDAHIADAALDLIEIAYEVLPAVTTIEAALQPDAPILHAHNITKGVEPKPRSPSNVGARTLHAKGDVAHGFEQADVIVERQVAVDTAHQGYLEPHAVVADTQANGMTTVWASTQGAFTLELQLAALLGKPQSLLKVVPLEVGGGFGGKIYAHIEPVAAKLSEKAGRPVRIVMNREEVMIGTGPACAARIGVRVGATRDGRLTAVQGTFHFDAGGFPGVPTTLQMQACVNPYQCANIHLEGFDVVTNKPRSESYRGPGGPQVGFAMEQAMDEVAERLAIDPLEFRRRNASVTGSSNALGEAFPPVALTTILDCIASHPCWTEPLQASERPRGRGLALGYWRGTSMTSACHVTLTGDGSLMVTIGAVDISGVRTAIAQVAAEEFGLKIGEVFVQTGDTKSVGFTEVSAGSRIARTMTAATHSACQDALGQLKQRAAELLQCAVGDVVYADREFRPAHGGASVTLKHLAEASLLSGAIVGNGVSTNLPLGVELGAHVCDVEVDPETGGVTILRYTAFQDVGRALNPAAIEGQIAGSVVQGLGWALTEYIDYDPSDGRVRNSNLLDYRMPTALDVPPIECVIIEVPVPDAPYGVKGVGEVPIIPPAAAVANAVRRATGRAQSAMPMTPERILRTLRGDAFGRF